MWGKHWIGMYTGSMRGAGSAFFAVWGFVLSHQQPNGNFGGVMTVELDAETIGFFLGEKTDVVAAVIEKMCGPDPRSRTKDEEGRKLVKLGEFTYRVVNGGIYRKLRNEAERREYQRIKQAEYRAAKAAAQSDPFSEPPPADMAEPPDMADLVVPPEMKKVGSVTAANTDSPAEAQMKRPEYHGEPAAIPVGAVDAAIQKRLPPCSPTGPGQTVPVTEAPAADQNGPVTVKPARVRAPWSRPADPAAPASDFP